MTFLLDENFPRAAKAVLAHSGHHVFDVRDMLEPGSGDNEVFNLAISLDAILLTTDRDFFHTVPYQQPKHGGVVVFALRQPNRSSILSRLDWFLKSIKHDSIRNRVYQVRDTTYVQSGI